MAKFVIIVLLVLVAVLILIDIFNIIKYRNVQQQTCISIAEVKTICLSARESATMANKKIYELKRALNEQDISTDFIAVKKLQVPKEAGPIGESYILNN